MQLLHLPRKDHPLADYGIDIPLADARAQQILQALPHLHRTTVDGELITRADLERAHDRAYIQSLLGDGLEAEIQLAYQQDPSWQGRPRKRSLEELLSTILNHCAGTYQAMITAQREGAAYFLGGGMHHAHAASGSGFCLLNDLLIAYCKGQREGRWERVLVIDVDAHYGDGTAALAQHHPHLTTLSIHLAEAWPLHDSTRPYPCSDFEIPILPQQSFQYQKRLQQGLSLALQKPYDLAVIVQGADPYERDQLESSAPLKLSLEQLAARDQLVYKTLKDRGIPQAYTMGGGYGPFSHEVYVNFLKSILTCATFFFCAVGLHSSPLWAWEERSQGEVSLETRYFRPDDDPQTEDRGLSLFTQIDASLRHQKWQLRGRAFARIDEFDGDRNLLAFQDLSLEWRSDQIHALVGYKTFHWSVFDTFRPADVINSRNWDSNLERLEKLGEPTLELGFQVGPSNVTFYFFPFIEDPHFPGERSRLGGFNLRNPVYLTSQGDPIRDAREGQWGTRWSTYFSGGDLSAFYLQVIDRGRPLFVPTVLSVFPVLTVDTSYATPYFYEVEHLGANIAYTPPAAWGPWFEGSLLRLEVVTSTYGDPPQVLTFYGMGRPEDHTLMAAGWERSRLLQNGHELTLLVEWQRAFGLEKNLRAERMLFQHDVMLGLRYALNDIQGSEVWITTIKDLERSSEWLFNASYSQRLDNRWKFTTGVRLIEADQKEVLPRNLEVYDEAHQLFFNLSRFF